MMDTLSSARSFWGQHGITIHLAPERGPVLVENSVVLAKQPDFGRALNEMVGRAGLRSLRNNQIPVVFLRRLVPDTIFKRTYGASAVGKLNETAAIALGRGAGGRTLSHEVGHVLGLPDVWQPWRLMSAIDLWGTAVNTDEVAKARDSIRIRSVGR